MTWHHALDTRILNKIPLLQGRDTAEFRSWQFVLKASLGLLDTAYSTDLPQVEALRSAMTQPDSADTRARSEKLYFILALTTADHAQVIVQQVESGHGYEAYQRLVEAHDPATSMRGLSMIEGILMAKFTSKNYLSQLQDWRLRVTRYEQKMGRALDDDVKASVLLRNAPETIRRQLQLNAEREGYTFEALYRHITGYMQLQTNYSDAGRLGGGSLGTVAQDDAMDVGGVTAAKGEKGKGKGKSKGKSKGGKAQGSRDGQACEKCGKTNHTTAECTYFDGACRYCGIHGHRERDCRKKQAASKGGGETAAVVTTPGPDDRSGGFRRASSDRGRVRLDPRCHEGSYEGAGDQDGGRGRVHRGQWLGGDDPQHRTGRQAWGGQSSELSVVVSHRRW